MTPIALKVASVSITQIAFFLDDSEATLSTGFLNELHNRGFSMTGGLYIFLDMTAHGKTIASDQLLLARNTETDVPEPNCTSDSYLPKHLNFMAFRNEARQSSNWGADFINAVIASNGGDIPTEWRELAFENAQLKSP